MEDIYLSSVENLDLFRSILEKSYFFHPATFKQMTFENFHFVATTNVDFNNKFTFNCLKFSIGSQN